MIKGPGTNWLRPTDITGHSHTHRTHIDIYYLIMSPDTCLYIQYIPIPPHTEFIPIPGIHPPLLIKLLFDLSPPPPSQLPNLSHPNKCTFSKHDRNQDGGVTRIWGISFLINTLDSYLRISNSHPISRARFHKKLSTKLHIFF